MKKIKVKPYMTNKSVPGFDFMQKWNNDNPMPLRIMVGDVIKETPGMVYMKLHADILSEKTCVCMKCGRPITNPVSMYFGMGPECGQHGYTNPFNSEEELKKAVESYKKELNNITWEGWVIKSAIEECVDLYKTNNESKVENLKKNVKIIFRDAEKLSCEQSAFISFPYDEKLISIMRNQSNRFWHGATKEWELPASKVDQLLPLMDKYKVEIIGQYEKPTPLKKVVLPSGFEFKTKPFNHQIEGFKYGLIHDKFLLSDDMGLGKTKQVIDIAVAKKVTKGYRHCLIICGVNGLKWNWQKEVQIHSNESSYILGQTVKKGKVVIGSNADKLSDLQRINDLPYFIITNVESLRDAKICEAVKQLCSNKTIEMTVIDEIHKCKNPASQQGKAILKIATQTRIAITGTPLMNSPIDLYVVLKWLGFEKHSFYQFKNHYCVMGGYGGYEVVGYRNLKSLHDSLNDIMIRRLKKDVLDLPDKIYSTEYVEMGKQQAAIYNEVKEELKQNIDKIRISSNPLTQLLRARQATGFTGILSNTIAESAKLDRLEEIVEELVSNNEKCIIFSNWTSMTEPTFERLKRFNPAIITGETKDRVGEQDKFMQDDSCKCIIGTIGAMGTGLTLTAASTVIFLDSPWNRANKEQAEDRAHRIGTKSNVNIITLVCKDTIDERIEDLVYKKGAMADMLVDGKTTNIKPEIIDYLLS